jgi:queuosine precursor transporter
MTTETPTNGKHSTYLVIVAAVFCIALTVSNIIAGKLWATPIPGVTLTTAVWLFPIVYILGDVIPEVYGLSTTRKIIWLGFAMNLFAVIFFALCIWLPYPPFWQNQAAFETVLGFTPRLLLASFVGYLVGTNCNAWVLVKIKALTNSKYLWVRTIGSTIVGETVDSLLFMIIAFWGLVPLAVLSGMILAQIVFKIGYEVLATPATYWVVGKFKQLEGVQ